MIRATIVLATIAAVALSAPAPEAPAVPQTFEDIPAEYKSLIPPEVAEHLKSITPADREILREVAKNYKSYKHEDDFLNALKEKSPALHEKASKLHAAIKAKVDALNPEAKAFVKKAIAKGREIHAQYLSGTKPSLESLKGVAKEHIGAYKALSPEAQASIAEHFPILTGFFKNDKVKALIEQHIN